MYALMTGKLAWMTSTAASTSAPNRTRETVRSASRSISRTTSTSGLFRQRSAVASASLTIVAA